ncbi:MAG: DUF302 domain-containing protein [Terracidiphilus sp.]|jgi:uncharacterized protein (DUF302 family)
MPLSQIAVERFSIVSYNPFSDIVAAFDAALGHPDMREFGMNVMKAGSWQELEHVVHAAIGPSGFMEFARFNLGQILSKEKGAGAPKILRIVFGNPLIMKQMAEHVHDAASYAPVTVLIDERPDGVHISYDRMASYLASYGNLAALEVARELDLKVERLLTKIAS